MKLFEITLNGSGMHSPLTFGMYFFDSYAAEDYVKVFYPGYEFYIMEAP